MGLAEEENYQLGMKSKRTWRKKKKIRGRNNPEVEILNKSTIDDKWLNNI